MSLSVLVKSASNLPNVERRSKSDPLCAITLKNKTKKTKYIPDNLDPEWNQTLSWNFPVALPESEALKVAVYDHEHVGSNRLLGSVTLSLRSAIQKGKEDVNTTLKNEGGEIVRGEKESGSAVSRLLLELTYTPPDKIATGTGQTAEGDEEGVPGDEGADSDGGGGPEDAVERRRSRQKKSDRAKLPNKPTDFQVRVHILEARQLVGGNVNPTVKILCRNSVKETSLQKGTNNPFWNEMMYFQFSERPEEMFEKNLEFKVLNAQILHIRNILLGSFKLDLGSVYDEPDHTYTHKWLLLTDPKNTAGDVKGYLKVSIQLLLPGDDHKPSPPTMSPESVDIESNLLRPLGVRLQPATLIVRLFRGEDFPQMDQAYLQAVKRFFRPDNYEKKELVDPYCTVSFAGHKGDTPVVEHNQDPTWNHQINFGVRLPSVSERIRFQVKDKDTMNPDDYIGTCFLKVSQISVAGDAGFLPTFGPCFINIYGSTREFSVLPDKYEHLNKGLIDGVAYRGRVMVEVEMQVGNLPTNKHEDIKIFDKNRSKAFLSRSSYKLFGTFFAATMVHPVDKAVQFEISIGNYGNKLDVNTLAQSSTTPATNPIYDGNKYYYLPWMEQKPCVVVDSQWEDCTYRIDSLNILTSIADTLEESLLPVKKTMDVGDYDVMVLKAELGTVLDELVENLENIHPRFAKQKLATLQEHGTKLDQQLRKHRRRELQSILEEVKDTCLLKLEEQVAKCEDYLARLRSIAVEPQNSIPDVIIWMLSGNKRVAYKRIPSHLVMFSPTARAMGKLCAKEITHFLTPPALSEEGELKSCKDGAQLRVVLWLGKTEYTKGKSLEDIRNDGVVNVYADTYENEVRLMGIWGTTGLTRPHWSNASGKIKQPKGEFHPTHGWDWDQPDWEIVPELSSTYDPEQGLDEYTDELYENQSREFFSNWPEATEHFWTDVRGAELKECENLKTIDDYPPTEGWKWMTETWEIDKSGTVDGEGWEYSVDMGLGEWVPYERNVHLARRRRWLRTRKRIKDPKGKKKSVEDEGWVYARLAHLTYHNTKRSLDFARRRRWQRRLKRVSEDATNLPVFHFGYKKKSRSKRRKSRKDEETSDEEEEEGYQQRPRMYFTFKEWHIFQLRAYLYQARDMYGSDRSGLSDPYAVVSFANMSGRSRIVNESVSPMWDQSIIFQEIRLFGELQQRKECPPCIVVEFFDKDDFGKDEFLGRTEMIPVVRYSLDVPTPRLAWYNITRYSKPAGELLAAFDLLLDEGAEMPFLPLTAAPPLKHYIVPTGIRPNLQNTRVEVLCWGVRGMKRFQLLRVSSPLVELECGGVVKRCRHIEDATEHPNFPEPVVFMDLPLPKENLYAPPLNIRILDKRSFGRKPTVGIHSIRSLKPYIVDPVHPTSEEEDFAVKAIRRASTVTPLLLSPEPVVIPIEDPDKSIPLDPDSKGSDFDWWSKYYASIDDETRIQQEYVDARHDTLQVYHEELEKSFNHFRDFAHCLPLYRGKGSRDPEERTGDAVGHLKCMVKVYPLTDDYPDPALIMTNVPSSEPIEVVVRVYIVEGIGLPPLDVGGGLDPYIKVKVGKHEINDRDNYIPNDRNPRFGKFFELPATLPLDHMLTVTVMDWDRVTADDLVGETVIDLEDRFLSRFNATCGLPQTFSRRGPNRWRDQRPPVQLLKEWYEQQSITAPLQWSHNKKRVKIGQQEYTLKGFEKETKLHPDVGDPQQRLALHILRTKGLVPEHVETRNLYAPNNPEGQLRMWVDIFSKDANVSPPVDISPRKPEKYELRVVVWDTEDVYLDETSVVTGEKMSDIYVKGWLRGEDSTQKTDVHYRSMVGEGNFNWRFVFPFEYIPAEQTMIIRKKEHFYSLTETEKQLPPILAVQIWDNDIFSPDDFIGTTDFNLSAVPKAAETASDCSLDQLSGEEESTNLFKKKRIEGWWPVYQQLEGGERDLKGKMKLRIEVVTEEEVELSAAGKGREEPNANPHLPAPERPATSFLWFTSPFKSCRYIIWLHHKWKIIGALLALLLVVIIVILIVAAPQLTFTNWFNDRLRGSKSSYSGPTVGELGFDLKDGILLIKLLENLTNKKIRGYQKAPKVHAQKMVNLDLAFTHMENEGIKLIGIGSHNIYEGNLKLILGLVWTLIQKYQLRMRGTQISTKTVMIQWLQALLPTWSISNLTTDWNDGRCLLALISEVKPGIGPAVSTLDPTKRKNNCALAIQIARNHLKIPPLIAPEDLSNPKIDDISVMTYLSYFCDPAEARLLKWVKKTIPHMNIHNFTTDWADGRAFAALTDACFPGTFPDWTRLQKGMGVENVKEVMGIANRRLGVVPNFTAKELASAEIEELKVMTYALKIRNGQLKALPEEILVSGPGNLKATVGKQTQFEIDTTQAGPGRLYIDAFYEDGKKVKFSLREKLPGIVALTYTPEEPGTVNFDILWSDIQIPKSPFSIRVTDSTLVKIVDFEHHERLVQVNVQVKLALNTKSAGQGIINAHLKYDSGLLIQANVTNFPDKTAVLQYTPPKAGHPVLHVFWNGEELTHLTITYTVVDNQKYCISTKPEQKLYRTFDHTRFSVQSESLPLEILQMTAILGDIQIPIGFKTIEGNTGHASFTPTLPGVYRIEVACVDKLVQGSPFLIRVVDPSRCKLVGVVPKYLKLGEPHEFQLNTNDAGVADIEFQCAEKQTDRFFKSEVHPLNSNGLQLLAVTPLKSGEFLVGVKFHDSHIPGSPFRVAICDPSKCQVVGDLVDRKMGIVGKPIRFKIVVSDTSEGIKPMVKAVGPSAKYSAEIRTTDDKTYSVQFTPWEMGTHEISITYGGYHIPHSPFLAAVMGFDSNFCSATGTGLQESLTGVPSQFVVLAKQSHLLEDGTLQIRVHGVVNKMECKVRIRDNQNGTYNVAYMTQVPGAYLISILAGAQHIPGSPFRLTAQPGPVAEKCQVYGPALEPEAMLTIGKPIDFSVDTVNAGRGQLTVKAVGPGGTQARVFIAKGDKGGIHDVKLDPVRNGKYRVSVKWSGRHIPGSPFLLKIFPGADASKCKAHGMGLEDGFVGKPSTFTIETRDAGAGTLKVRLHGVKDAFKIEIKPIDQRDVRTLQARYDPKKPGEYLVTIRWSDAHIPGSPFRVKITGEPIMDDGDKDRPTPHYAQELDIISEEGEEKDEDEIVEKEKEKKKHKKKNRVQFVPVMPVSMMIPPGYIDPGSMPVFKPDTNTPYQFAFIPPPPSSRKRKKTGKGSKTISPGSPTKDEGSTTSLPPTKMLTFSNLQQVRRYAKTSQQVSGDYHGQAAMQMNTRRFKEPRRLTKSLSDSVAIQKNRRHY